MPTTSSTRCGPWLMPSVTARCSRTQRRVPFSTPLKSSSNGCVKLNSDIQLLNENKNSPIIIHILKNNNPLEAKVVAIDKNTDKSYLKYDYFKSQDAYIVFKTWYN